MLNANNKHTANSQDSKVNKQTNKKRSIWASRSDEGAKNCTSTIGLQLSLASFSALAKWRLDFEIRLPSTPI